MFSLHRAFVFRTFLSNVTFRDLIPGLTHFDKYLSFLEKNIHFYDRKSQWLDLSSSVVVRAGRDDKHYVTPTWHPGEMVWWHSPKNSFLSFNWKLMDMLKDVEENTSFISEVFWIDILFECKICFFLRICFLELQSCPTQSSSATKWAPTSYKRSYTP